MTRFLEGLQLQKTLDYNYRISSLCFSFIAIYRLATPCNKTGHCLLAVDNDRHYGLVSLQVHKSERLRRTGPNEGPVGVFFRVAALGVAQGIFSRMNLYIALPS